MAYRAGTAFIQIAPSFKGFQLKLSAEAKKLRAIEVPATLNVDSKAAETHLAALTKPRDVAINANVDTAAATTKLDLLTRTRTVKINADTSAAERKVASVARGGSGGGSLLMTAGLAAAPLAGPLLAAGGAAGAGLSGIGVGLGSGALGFGLLATAEIKRAQKAQGALAKAQQQVATARTNLSNATTPGQRKGDTKTLNEALQTQKAAAANIGPQQQKGLAAIASLKKAWDGLLTTVSKPIFAALTPGIHRLEGALPAVARFIKPVSAGIANIFDIVGRPMASRGFQQFATTLGKFSSVLLTDAGFGIRNLATGFGNILKAFMPLSKSMSTGLVNLTQRFADWSEGLGKSKGFQKFIGYIKTEGPIILSTLGSIATVIGKLIIALAPFGAVMLKGLQKVFGFLAKLSPGQLLAIAGGITALFLAFKVGLIAARIATLEEVTALGALNVVMDANPIGIVVVALTALAAGLVYAYNHSKTFRKIVDGAFLLVKLTAMDVTRWFTKSFVPFFTKTIPNAFHATVNWVKHNWPLVLAIITGPIGLATLFIVRHWNTITGAFKDAKNWVVGTWQTAWSRTENAIMRPLTSARDGITHLFGPNGPIRSAFSNAVSAIGKIWSALRAAAAKPVNFVIGTVYNNGIRKALNLLPGVNLKPAGLVKFATGGSVNGGTPGQDSVPAMLMPGEHVWTAKEVAKVGGHKAMYAMRQAVQRFADGGQVLDYARSGLLHWGNAASFARSQVGKPYVWGGVGPGGYDCSGFMSAITNVLRGMNPHQRVGSTASFPWAGFVRGPGEFTIGSTNRYPGSSVGHMAGTLAGMNVESRGGTGVIVGPGARGYNDPGFNRIYHIGAAGNFGHGGGGLSNPLAALHVADWVKRLKSMGGFGPMLAAIPGHLVSSLAGFVKKQIRKAIGVVGDAIGAVGHGFNTLGAGSTHDKVQAVANILGWGHGSEWSALSNIIAAESGWNPRAENPTSTASGLFQMVDATARAYGLAGHASRFGIADQSKAGLRYIKGRYADPANAWSFHQHHGWYDQGGYLPPGLSTVYNGTGKPEPVLTSRQFADIRSLADSGGKGGWTANYGDVYTYDIDEFRRKQRADMRKLEMLASLPT